MKRRNFIQHSTLAGLGLSLLSSSILAGCAKPTKHTSEYKTLIQNLLKEWCDGMISTQIIDPSNPSMHGQMDCPSCEHIHARVMDAVYPFFYMAKTTGDKKYLDAGIAAFEWGKNVTRDDGAWTNDLDPKSWDGTTVFGAISLAEALHYHGDLIDNERRKRWYNRLEKAAQFVAVRFPVVGNANINYAATTIYALHLFGKMLNKPKYTEQSKAMAEQIKSHFTKPGHFLYGEIQGPNKHRLSEKGLLGIDLGYNVEESLNNLVLYALEVHDDELLKLVRKSMETHLEFIMPDGGLDNGFGNRMYKWTYWGSRTSDGMQPAYSLMAKHNPAFGTAAFKNAELLKQCTHNGLLHGGLHYVSHGIKPCIHHTFAHAKPLALILEHWGTIPEINKSAPLPRKLANGIKYYKELDVSTFGRGNWRGTVSAYDAEYNPRNDCRQASGASLSMLYHNKVGLLCSASMATYKMQEAYNQQPAPGEDIALTPRIEIHNNSDWYTNLYDLAASFEYSDENGSVDYKANVQLRNEKREVVTETASDFWLQYRCTKDYIKIIASSNQAIAQSTSVVVPIVSPSGEKVSRISNKEISIQKPEGLVKISCNVALKINGLIKKRTFNMVPGIEAIPIFAEFTKNNKVEIKIEVI